MTAQKADQLLQGQDRDKASHITLTDLKNTWELLSQQSTFEYDNCIKKIMLGKKALSFNYHGLHSALVELSSSRNKWFQEYLILVWQIYDTSKWLYEFFKKVNKLDASVNIMSCWSEELTRSSLSGDLVTLEVKSKRNFSLSSSSIFSRTKT
ncbi:hypothetical protein MKW98_007352 [Papaver atlanticum]|uniref:Uncharacterized protein n=1 Tax=Papaver atlanticum TaxID=357466 RepID=A0AAD4SBB2_9MAGN|nr:hypothetical protein MKW98_007352 [Papaver atlanticum]